METDERVRELIGAMQEELRADQGTPPTPEEILALLEGRLAETDRLRVEEGIAAFPEAARLARALRRFPDQEPSPEEREPDEAAVAARWQAFKRRLDEAGTPVGSSDAVRVTRPRPSPWPVFRLAAALVCGLALGVLTTSVLRRPDARVNLVPVSAVSTGSEGRRAGEARTETVPAEAGGLLLAVPFAAAGDLPEYALAIYDSEGHRVWQRRGLVRSRQGPFYLVLPPGLLAAGRYRLELTDPAAPSAPPLAEYEMRIEVE